jgi:hypothetical protein
MSISGDIRTALLAMNAVTALVGTGTAARIRPDTLDDRDDNNKEHIVIDVDRLTPQNDLMGTGGLTYAEVNISCRAATRTQVDALATAVKRNGTSPGTGLAGYGGSGTAFHAVLDGEVNSEAPREDGSQRTWYTVEQTYIMSFSEDV